MYMSTKSEKNGRNNIAEFYQNCTDSPEIIKCEVEAYKACSLDDTPTELLKLIEDNDIKVLVSKIFNSIYNTGVIHTDWLKSIFVAILKKHNMRKCSEYRLISLMSHTLNIFLRILPNRIRRKCEDLEDTQFGFRNAMETREALFALNILLQKCQEKLNLHVSWTTKRQSIKYSM
ncbi:unnamed protein product [Diabrotica balteata]|uniref:Reverse transcriptase domain-containing protein n=1 Tax=Diabrotica balteata TaxID=107213 RepID=A0A9N9T3Q7_DIABA|nr:unnamed protein product [Diabrotica balteata]